MRRLAILALIVSLGTGCAGIEPASAPAPTSTNPPEPVPTQVETEALVPPPAVTQPMQLRSPAFEPLGEIPAIYTCDGEDSSPELTWEDVPEAAASLAFVFDDPDAGGWVHWVVYDLPAEMTGLPAGLRAELSVAGSIGANTWGDLAYGGPCPPTGSHRYVFTLYALDAALGLAPGATAEEFKSAAEGHVLATADLTGTYERP